MKESPPAVLLRDTSAYYSGELGKAYFDYQRDCGLLGGAVNSRFFQPFVAADDAVMDFGAGSGALLAHLKCAHRIAVEINPAARAFCSDTFGIPAYERVVDLPDTCVDVVVSSHCIEHLPSPVATLEEFHRVMKPRARLLLLLPIDDWRTQRAYMPADIDRHLYTWTPLLLGNMLQSAGFKVQEVKVLDYSFSLRFGRLWTRIPMPLFDLLCRFWAIARKRRQLFARATG